MLSLERLRTCCLSKGSSYVVSRRVRNMLFLGRVTGGTEGSDRPFQGVLSMAPVPRPSYLTLGMSYFRVLGGWCFL
jgi:hypothetical protein